MTLASYDLYAEIISTISCVMSTFGISTYPVVALASGFVGSYTSWYGDVIVCDLRDPDAAIAAVIVRILQNVGKIRVALLQYRDLPGIWLTVGAPRRVNIGDVLGYDVHPQALGCQSRAADIHSA